MNTSSSLSSWRWPGRGSRMSPSKVMVVAATVATMAAVWSNKVLVAEGCTDVLVTRGASSDGSSMIAYNADDAVLYGILYHYAADPGEQEEEEEEVTGDSDDDVHDGVNDTNQTTTKTSSARSVRAPKKRKMKERKIYEWDSGRYLGVIELDARLPTYNVVGNGNEHGLVIGETTFGGVSVLAWNQTRGVVDYGSLIYIALQYCKTSREAIHFMSDLLDRFGYASGGESLSLSDAITGEVWIMELIGRGNTYQNGTLGAVYVARKLPDGSVSAHANQARITAFPRDDPDNCVYSKDVVDVAVHYGLYRRPEGDHDNDESFSFADAYHPPDFATVRHGDARVWSVFSQVMAGNGNGNGNDRQKKGEQQQDNSFAKKYEDYATGQNLTNRMPLYVFPTTKVSLQDVMGYMNSHYENTVLDAGKDVGSGLFASPYRPRPLEWTHQEKRYVNERTIGIAKTGWNFVAHIRPNMPEELSVVLWFACDDSSTSPRVPVYTSSTEVSAPYEGKGSQDGVMSPMLTLDMSKAFWIQNMVSNFAYFRWSDVYPVLRKKIDDVHQELFRKVQVVDRNALALYNNETDINGSDSTITGGKEAAVRYVTMFSTGAQKSLHAEWTKFYGELFVRFRDYYDIVPKEDDPLCGCEPKVHGMSDAVKQRIVDETGDHYRVPSTNDGGATGDSSYNRNGQQLNHYTAVTATGTTTTVIRGEWYEYGNADNHGHVGGRGHRKKNNGDDGGEERQRSNRPQDESADIIVQGDRAIESQHIVANTVHDLRNGVTGGEASSGTFGGVRGAGGSSSTTAM